MTAFVANTNLLKLTGLKDDVDGTFINNATVAVTVVDSAGAQVSGASWPLTMPYVAATNGDYRVALADGLGLTANGIYTAQVTADGGTDRKGRWDFQFRAQARR